MAFGRRRNQLLSPLAERLDQGGFDKMNPEVVRKLISNRDAKAAKAATAEVNRRHGGKIKLPRKPSARERRSPREFQEEREQFLERRRLMREEPIVEQEVTE